MGTTSTYGLRFQELGDTPDGAALGENLANDVEAQLERIDATAAAQDATLSDHESRLAPHDPVRMASGHVGSVNYDGSSDTLVPVSFPPGRFTAPPRVTATITNGNVTGSSGFAACWSTSVTTEGMTLRFRRSSADPSMGADWTAIQDDEEVIG